MRRQTTPWPCSVCYPFSSAQITGLLLRETAAHSVHKEVLEDIWYTSWKQRFMELFMLYKHDTIQAILSQNISLGSLKFQ